MKNLNKEVLHILHCPLSGPDLTYISLLIIFCIIEYVTNKKTLNLGIWKYQIKTLTTFFYNNSFYLRVIRPFTKELFNVRELDSN